MGCSGRHVLAPMERARSASAACTSADLRSGGPGELGWLPAFVGRWSSVAGCDCGFDVVEEGLEYPVMKRLDPLTPYRLPLPGRAAFDRVAKDGRVVGTFQLEPLLALQLGRPDHPERTGGTWAVDLFPEHQPCVVQTVSLRPGSRSDLRRPDTAEVGDERGYLLWRCRDSPFMVVLDLHPSSTSG